MPVTQQARFLDYMLVRDRSNDSRGFPATGVARLVYLTRITGNRGPRLITNRVQGNEV